MVVSLLSEGQEFQVAQAKDAREAAARLGLDVEVLFAEGHAVVQIQQIFRFVHVPEGERPAAIVLEATVGEGLERVARNAVRAGIGWVLVNTRVAYVDALRAERPELPIAMIGSDQKEVGRIQGRQCRAPACRRAGASCACRGRPTPRPPRGASKASRRRWAAPSRCARSTGRGRRRAARRPSWAGSG